MNEEIIQIYNKIFTPFFCQNVIINNPDCLVLIPDIIKTYELCFMAVMIKAESIRFVPSKLLTKELCYLACFKNPELYKEFGIFI